MAGGAWPFLYGQMICLVNLVKMQHHGVLNKACYECGSNVNFVGLSRKERFLKKEDFYSFKRAINVQSTKLHEMRV